MTTDDATKLLLLLGMFTGQVFLLVLLSALQREDWPAPFWRWTEDAYETMTSPIERVFEALARVLRSIGMAAYAATLWATIALTGGTNPKGPRHHRSRK